MIPDDLSQLAEEQIKNKSIWYPGEMITSDGESFKLPFCLGV